LNVFIHVLAAFLWLGGMLFFALVAAPVLRGIEPADLRARLFQRLGESFRLVGWIAIALLLITGTANLAFRGWLRPALSGDALFWSSPLAGPLRLKLGCVVSMLILSIIHDFFTGPKSTRASPGSPEALRLRRRAAWLARLNALAGILLVYASVRLARGG
jgi:putative copper export protein